MARARLLYDADCGFCSRCASVVGSRRRIEAAPAADAAELDALGLRGVEADTVVMVSGDRAWTESAAVVRALWRMGWGWPVAGALVWLVPRPVRDAGYRWVARNRHRLMPGACDVGGR